MKSILLIWMIISAVFGWCIATDEFDNTSRQLVQQQKKKTKLLGECEVDCNKDSDCANGLLCAQKHRNEIINSGWHRRKAYCDTKKSKNNKDVCYDPEKLDDIRCSNPKPQPGDKCNMNDPMKCYEPPYCCRVPIEIYNNGTKLCTPIQCMYHYGCDCDTTSWTWQCFTAKPSCADDSECINK